jgi:putative redox protein
MADVDIGVRWAGRGLEFLARGRAGTEVLIDGDTQTSISPVETLLVALATCMAADIMDIGVKSRLPITSLDVAATGMRNPEPPRRYLSARLVFTVGGVSDEDAPKLDRALALSREKYCSVIHTLRQDLPVELELVRVASDAAVAGTP